jgi:phosphoglycerate dehydrogenase-like enzyme
MRFSRWGRSEYETDAHLAAEAAALGPYVEVRPMFHDAEIVVVTSRQPLGPAIRARAPSVRWVLTTTSGVDHLDREGLAAIGVGLGRTPLARRDAVVETALAWMLAGLRCTVALQARSVVWDRHQLPQLGMRTLRGARVGVVGLGVIGRRMAELLDLLGATVFGCDPRGLPAGLEPASVDEMLETCDALTLHCDLNPTSRGLLSAERLGRARPGLVLINTARGESVDVDAALAAFKAGRLGALGLDVFPEEPWPRLGEFASTPGCFVGPHAAGYHERLAEGVSEGLVASVRAVVAGDPLPWPV